ncbi:MAG: hypothetical protein OXJ54_04450 [Gemmatimonadetes bacterium]|nr:hypothetical protein [Candidatus Palauibacter rhopaloidicola]
MTRHPRLIAFVIFAGLPASAQATQFSYSYLELTGDLSKTENTAQNPVGDADGRLLGISGSWKVFDSVHLKGAWSRETKGFSNEVAGTPLDLDSEQTVGTLGAGVHFGVGERTSIYAEALAIVDFGVEHLVPMVVPSMRGPPSVSTVESTLDGRGFSAAVGVRRWVGERLELEGQFSRIQTSVDVLRTGEELSDAETMLRAAAHLHAGAGFSIGTFFAFSKHTDDNFDNIRKLGVSLRYHP